MRTDPAGDAAPDAKKLRHMSSSTSNQTRAKALAYVQALIAGTNKHFPNGSFTLGSTVYTTASLLAVLQGLAAAMTALAAAQANAKDALAERREGGRRGEGEGHARCAWDHEQEAEARDEGRRHGGHRDPRDGQPDLARAVCTAGNDRERRDAHHGRPRDE